ncbi:hypothetical protein [Leucobacter musarum]|uniref:hypothetical protein n=1 Tax=Leucobacter musarum TaxID=1930747 RepID=UPI0006A7BFCB|nr:hypothetical protein [Leucobacter musarum]
MQRTTIPQAALTRPHLGGTWWLIAVASLCLGLFGMLAMPDAVAHSSQAEPAAVPVMISSDVAAVTAATPATLEGAADMELERRDPGSLPGIDAAELVALGLLAVLLALALTLASRTHASRFAQAARARAARVQRHSVPPLLHLRPSLVHLSISRT